MDNVLIERLWRSMQHECVYLSAFETGTELCGGLGRWIAYDNTRRPHSALAGRVPNEMYRQIVLTPSHGHAPERGAITALGA